VRIARALALPLTTLMLASCSGTGERTLLTQFFAASRLRDLTALHNFSTVVFEPATDGIVTGFDVLRIAAVPSPDGRLVSKNVLISASVRAPDGRTAVKAFTVTMTLGVPGSDPRRWDGWTITAIKAGLESPSTPRS
jgi:hypothetical protein